jgi:hypothetical protein
MTTAQIKAQTRKSKKLAAYYEADNQESHLNPANFTYKRGQSGRKAVAVEEQPTDFLYDKEINALYETPKNPYKKKQRLLKKKRRRR